MINCTHHFQNPITLIYKAPHKCQFYRILCSECQNEHGVILKHTIPLKIFREISMKKLKDTNLNDTTELTKQRLAFKSLLSQTELMLNKIWEELSQSIKQVYDQIEKENQSYLNLINENTNLAESSYKDLEKLVNIVEGQTLIDWNEQKNSQMIELDKTMNWGTIILRHLLKCLTKESNRSNHQLKFNIIKKNYQKKFVKGKKISLKYQRPSRIQMNLSIKSFLKYQFYEFLNNNQENIKDVKKQVKIITNVLKNIQDHQFSKDDYSSETFEKARQDLLKRLKDNKEVIDFIKFIVLLTSLDVKFIQGGSNGLSLLVQMKVDIRNQSFENIRMKNTSLIGGNFV
ncbi:unnamed protein product [Paramecium pentaurelia]|uniref:Uncharacterized protein n=1 Tax=Paramecium pentaurelia TaxID=43138 RepID=A0A8S1UUA5_9CILI|nr:unnamed protein product [Paramecium pentaurelia]